VMTIINDVCFCTVGLITGVFIEV